MDKTAPCEGCQSPDKTIDDCYNEVIQRLTDQGKIKEVSEGLVQCRSFHEKVIFVYKLIKDLAFLPIVKTNPKNDQVAVYYRNLGNSFFQQHKHYEAWQAYNLSLLYAEGSSEHFIYAVSNRSAVFYSMKKYDECIKDIDFVFSTAYPEKLRSRLIERKNKCLKFLKEVEVDIKEDPYDSEIAEILKMKSPKDDMYVSASSKLQVVYTKEMGRHVIAKEDIKPGEVLVEEEPYLTVLLKSQFVFCCAYCLSRSMNLYPCLNCTYSLYCSVECRENAYHKYHLAECGLLPSLISMEFTKLEWLSLRTLIRSRTDENDWPDMYNIVKEANEKKHTDLWGCVKVNDKWVYDSKYYASIHTLESNFEKRSMSDIFQKCVTAAVITHFLSVLHFLKTDQPLLGKRARKYVTDLLLRHIMTAPTNMHSISANIENEDGNFVEECQIACGAYAFHSLLNHSCAPNVVRCVKLGTAEMKLVAIRPIKKGMQIFDNYGASEQRRKFVNPYDPEGSMRKADSFPKYHHALTNRGERRKLLKAQYKFVCTCDACVNDWPKHENLEEAKGVPAEILQKKEMWLSSDNLNKLMKADKEAAVKCYGPLCELIEALDPFAPCKELAECQEALKQCLAIFQGVIPHGYTKEVKWNWYPPCVAMGGPPHFGGYIPGPALAC